MTTVRFKPIQTRYAGCRFRSRIEARWAIFFDTLGLRWEYEREGYELDGERYLPDFWLPELHTWVEIKGIAPNDREVRLAGLLADATNSVAAILHGDIPVIRYGLPDPMGLSCHSPTQFYHQYILGECPNCGRFRFAYPNWKSIPCDCINTNWKYAAPPFVRFDSTRLVYAYTVARSARFEHGEDGR